MSDLLVLLLPLLLPAARVNRVRRSSSSRFLASEAREEGGCRPEYWTIASYDESCPIFCDFLIERGEAISFLISFHHAAAWFRKKFEGEMR